MGKGLDGAGLKNIAMVTMFIDHVAAGFIKRILTARGIKIVFLSAKPLLIFYNILRGIGRISFPIYIFLLVEGFLHTRSRWKYTLRMALLALISEVPYDLLFKISDSELTAGHILEFSKQNVFFSLTLGLLMMMLLEKCENYSMRLKTVYAQMTVRTASVVAVIAAFMLLARYVVRCDYGAWGIMAMGVMYVFREEKKYAQAMTCACLTVTSWSEISCFLALIPMFKYNGERGRQNKILAYAFYPAHLLLIWLLCLCTGYIMI